MESKLERLVWEHFANEFAGWEFLDSSRELKVIEFQQLRQTEEMSMDKYINKFLDLLQYMGQAYDIEQKKAMRYAVTLYSMYSFLILAVQRESFYTIIDAARKMEANAIT